MVTINKEINMLDLLIAIDLEVKYARLRAADASVDNLALLHPHDMRRLFIVIYKLMPSKLALEYEVRAHERKLAKVDA